MKNITGLIIDGKEITLVGTAHVSSESVKEVKEVIDTFKPDVVGVELCSKRYEALKDPDFNTRKISSIIKNGDFKLLLFQTLLYWYQSRVGEGLKITPGAEMIEALNQAEKSKIKVELIDRDINTTITRMLNNLTLKEKLNLLVSLYESLSEELSSEDVEALKSESSVDSLIKAVSKESPTLKKVLVDERDEFIAERIKNINAKRIVAFIGAGHVKGVKKNLRANVKKKLVVKEVKKEKNLLSYTIPFAFLAFLLIVLFKAPEYSGQMLLYYSLFTFLGAFLGGLFSLAHPLSVIVGALSAPLTVLHPLFTSGMVSAFVESRFRKVKVKDLEDLARLKSVRDAYSNNLSRLLLVFVLTNLFTSISALIVFPYMISLLF